MNRVWENVWGRRGRRIQNREKEAFGGSENEDRRGGKSETKAVHDGE